MDDFEIGKLKLDIIYFQQAYEHGLMCLKFYEYWMEKIKNEDPERVDSPKFQECQWRWTCIFEEFQEDVEHLIYLQKELEKLEGNK